MDNIQLSTVAGEKLKHLPLITDPIFKDELWSEDDMFNTIDDIMFQCLSDDITEDRSSLFDSLPDEILDSKMVILVRLYLSLNNDYKYHIVYTDDILSTLMDINSEYDCDWDITVVLCVQCDSQDTETEIRHGLLKLGHSMDRSLYTMDKKIIEYMESYTGELLYKNI